MKKVLNVLSVLFIVIVLVTSCKKKTVTGPAGPQGIQGVKGNANVTNLTFTVSSWAASGSAYVSDYLSLPNLDSTIFVSGTVMSYYLEASVFYPLPFTTGYYTIQPEYGLNHMRLYVYNNDHTPMSAPGGSVVIRVVIIPPAIKIQHPTINYHNYSEVKKMFNLKD